MAGRKGEYLFKRAGSENWHIRFVYPVKPGQDWPKQVQFSLGTPDRLKAEIDAAEHIKRHKLVLHTMRALHKGAVKRRFGHRYAPNKEHQGANGERVVATADQLIFLDATGSVLRVEPNEPREAIALTMSEADAVDAGIIRKEPLPPPKKDDADEDIHHIERWVKHASVTPHIEREARLVFETFKRLTEGKRFADATFDDGVALHDHLFEQGQAYATVKKKLGHLRAAVNLAIKSGKHRHANPFSGVMRKKVKGDIQRRQPLDDDDMALARKMGPQVMSEKEWLLWVLLATTGMRLDEAVTIENDHLEEGVRFVFVGTKNEQSERRVPLPDAVLELVPDRITGPLFPGEHSAMLSKRMNRRMTEIGIVSPLKVVHSLRHRAKDKLRRGRLKPEEQYEILGHEKKTVAAGYGHGSPVTMLKEWVEKIGF